MSSSLKKKESISGFGVVVHDMQRFATIANVLRKFGFGNIVRVIRDGAQFESSSELLNTFNDSSADLAPKIRATIEELGTTYIKFGQMLSTRYDLLPPNFVKELEKLQDGSPKMDFETVEGILNDAYGDYHSVFETIEEEPLGAASIAQVHRAVLKNGDHVVVKIQRPGLLPLIRSDIDILNVIAKTLDNNIEEISYFDLPALISEFERSIIAELDFKNEMQNIEYFIEHYRDHQMIVFPTPYPDISRHNILVMRELLGQKITTVTPDTEKAHEMADAILNIAFDMVFKEGVFHADPHPGNVFAMPDGKIGLLDFGLVGKFSVQQRSEFTHLIMGVHFGDCRAIARILLSLGHPTKRVILKDLEAEISTILQKYYVTSLKKIDVAAFAAEFVAAGQKFAVQIPSEFTNAVRALINVEGIIQYLNPNLDIVKTLAQFAEKLFLGNVQSGNLMNVALRTGLSLSEFCSSAPSQITQVMQDLEHDGLSVRIPDNINNPMLNGLNSMTTRLCLSLMLIGLTIALALISGKHPLLFDIVFILDLLWCIVLVCWHIQMRTTRAKFRINPMLKRMKRRRKWF